MPYITHTLIWLTFSLVLPNRRQFIRVKYMPLIADTLIWLTVYVVLPNHTQFIPVNRMLYIAHAFIWLPVSFVPPHPKQLIELNRMPCIAHATKFWTVFDASVIANVLHIFDGFLHHHLRFWHHTQFHRRVSDRSVAFGPSCSSEPIIVDEERWDAYRGIPKLRCLRLLGINMGCLVHPQAWAFVPP